MELAIKIEEFLKLIDTIRPEYNRNFEIVGEMDKQAQDQLHSLELDNLNYKERAKLATQMYKSRKERRYAKDMVSLLEPFEFWISDQLNAKAINKLKIVLGEVRKKEDAMAKRIYRKRGN